MSKQILYFMNVESLKELSLIENNVEAAKLAVMMNRVQKTYIEPILGTPLFKKILTDIDDDTVAGIYETLLNEYIIDYYVLCCELEYIVSGSNKLMNMGSAKYEPQNTSQNELSENNDVRDNLKKHLARYKNTLVGYLEDNKENIPEYLEFSCKNGENINPDKQQSTVPSFGIITRKKV